MIDLPDLSQEFTWENNFYLSCQPARVGKFMAHYEMYKLVSGIPGALVECGVFKGASLARFACFRKLIDGATPRDLIGFDTFGTFPQTAFDADKPQLEKFISAAGDQSISVDQLIDVLQRKNCGDHVELIPGNICETVPDYLNNHPDLRIALLNLDTDVYEPAVVILNVLYPRIEKGGVLLLDDYGVFPGETKAVDDYFAGTGVEIRRFPWCSTPCYIIKP
jgi:hypothetical protein